MSISQPVQITDGLWWVGDAQTDRGLRCNPYLLFEGGSVILFDPGSVLDAEPVMEQIRTLVPIEEIDAVVLSHQDPDLCSALPLFEQNGFSGVLCCHERAAAIITFYGVKSPYYLVNREKYRYELADGSYIRFLPAPYLHFPGALMSYLPQQKTLISGDLFGAFSDQWSLFAENDYIDTMKSFHESYMPSREILHPVMENLLGYDIRIICPQHGSIITEEIQTYIETLRDLPCGLFLNPVRQDLLEAGGYPALCSQVLKRLIALFNQREVRSVFRNAPFTIDYSKREIVSADISGEELWQEFFALIYDRKGFSWLTAVSPLVEGLTKQYAVALPKIFETIIFDAHKNRDLANTQHLELEKQRSEIAEAQYRCPITKLYNHRYFNMFMNMQVEAFYQEQHPFCVMLLSIDNLADINVNHGSEEGNAALQNLAYMLTSEVSGNKEAFRLEGGLFALYMSSYDRETVIDRANTFKNEVAESRLFITPVTVSIGLYHSEEISRESIGSPEEIMQLVLQTARFRLRIAKRRGGNTLVYDSDLENNTNAVFTVLLVDDKGLPMDLIRRELERESFHVVTAHDGLEAKRLTAKVPPDVIISEQMTMKLSAFTLRKQLLDNPKTRHIPFILLTHNKQEYTVEHALSLGITYILPRPVILAELIGIVKALTESITGEVM